MAELFTTVSTGDKVYFYDKSLVMFFSGPRKVLSTSVYNGGYHEEYEAVYNHDGKQGSGMPCEMLADTYVEHMMLVSERLGLNPLKVSGMGTAASMENAVVETLSYKELTVTAIVTGGIETNGGRVGDPATYYHPMEKPNRPGTINIMLVLDCDMPPGTLARALVTCTEAKTAAIQELMAGSNYSKGLATGSGTDQTMIVANPTRKLYLEGAGKHAKMGELIGRVVKQGVKRALEKQSGLNPSMQHNVLRRWKRFGVVPLTLWQAYRELDASSIKPEYLLAIEELAQEKLMLVESIMYIHLLDEYMWGLITVEELRLGAVQVLEQLSQGYGVNSVGVEGADMEQVVAAWSTLFNEVVLARLGKEREE